jgi:hypothetical protein
VILNDLYLADGKNDWISCISIADVIRQMTESGVSLCLQNLLCVGFCLLTFLILWQGHKIHFTTGFYLHIDDFDLPSTVVTFYLQTYIMTHVLEEVRKEAQLFTPR